MSRFYSYTIFFVTLLILFELSGLGLSSSGFQNLIGFTSENLENGWSIKDIPLYTIILGVLTVAVAGIALTFFAKSPAENYIVLPFIAGTAVLFLDVITGITVAFSTYDATWATSLVAIILIPIAIGYLITCVEFFRGNV